MKCTCCGNDLKISDRYCSICGQNNPSYIEPEKKKEPTTSYNLQKNNYNNNNNYNGYSNYNNRNNYRPNNYTTKPYSCHEESQAIAILALIFSILGSIVGLILSIVGLCIYKESKNRNMCIAGLIISIVEPVILIIAYVLIFIFI